MSRSKALSSALGAAFIAASLGMTAPAMAMDIGCAPKAQVVQALHDEGQVQIVTGERATVGMPHNIFTTNEDMSVGYVVEAGTGPQSDTACVKVKYTDIHLNKNPDLARPTWASFGASSQHDAYLRDQETRLHDHVLMGATGLVRQPDGSERRGAFVMVTMGDAPKTTPYKSAGAATVTSAKGGISTMMALANVEPTNNFRVLASKPIQTALVDTARQPSFK